VQIGEYDKVSGWSYPYTVVQRNGLSVKVPGEAVGDDEIAFRVIGGFGGWNRAFRPGGFAAYFIGTQAQAEAFRVQLEKLIESPASAKEG
jgi:hypothetical protein